MQLIGESHGSRIGRHLHIGLHVLVKHATRNIQLHAGTGNDIRLVPAQQCSPRAMRFGNGLPPAMHCESIGGTVAESVFQLVSEVIIALLVDAYPTAPRRIALREAKWTAGKQERFGIKRTRTTVDIVVYQPVDGTVFGKRHAVRPTAKHLHAVNQQADGAHTVNVGRAGHVIIGTNGHADDTPRLHAAVERMSSLRPLERLRTRAAIDHSLTRTGINAKTARQRTTRIPESVTIERKRVQQLVRSRAAQFQMQMRTTRGAGISTAGNDFATRHAEQRTVRTEIDRKTFAGILLLTHIAGNGGRKRIEMSVHRSMAGGMNNVERIAITHGTYSDAAHVTFIHGPDGFARHTLRLDVKSAMEVIRTQFAEVGTEQHGKIKRSHQPERVLRAHRQSQEKK